MSEELTLEGKFLTAKELSLIEPQRCGLIKTLAWLEAGKLDHENEKTAGFSMKRWGGSCGSVCCIGGTAEVLGETKYPQAHRWWETRHQNPDSLIDLFFPNRQSGGETGGWTASTSQAAVALRGYLETGTTNWDHAMSTPRNGRRK